MGNLTAAQQAIRRAALYLIIAGIGNLVWEAVQIPLYTVWWTGTKREIFVAVTHCTGGDVLIATSTLLIGALLTWVRGWCLFGYQMMLTTVVLGVAYMIFSEWLNVKVWNNWSYSSTMPVLPWFGTGLASLLQWFVVPVLAFVITGRVAKSLDRRPRAQPRPALGDPHGAVHAGLPSYNRLSSASRRFRWTLQAGSITCAFSSKSWS